MCTAIKKGDYVGRNLDVYKTYGESIIIMPRKYTLAFSKEEKLSEHFAVIGMGTVSRGYPLYYDAANEYGLYMAGLNYVGNAKYGTPREGYVNLAPYELIPYILSKCRSVKEARSALSHISLIDVPFSREMPCAQLHFMISDKAEIIVAEPDENGINIYDNPTGVLSNNPNFPDQMLNLAYYSSLSAENPESAPDVEHGAYSEGMGALGMPGDLSSRSRFIRAAFHTAKARRSESVTDIFHLLGSVEMPDGSVKVADTFERTEYSSAVNLGTMTYYYRAYDSASICAVRLFSENIDTSSLIGYPVLRKTDPYYQN